MSDKKTPEQRARELYYTDRQDDDIHVIPELRRAYLKGRKEERADFIQNELPKLLEMAREGMIYEGGFTYLVADLIAMAEKGEV